MPANTSDDRDAAALDADALHDFRRAIDVEGWGVPSLVVEAELLNAIGAEIADVGAERRGGLRDPLEVSAGVRRLARHKSVRGAAEAVLGLDCFVARALLFDKTARANWKVAWHQDLTITVAERRDATGYGPWSTKAGIVHVQPPVEVLERMLAVRVHLDDCGPTNGPVRVLAGSHRAGRLDADGVEAWKKRAEPIDCLVARGAILAFRPLLLHASSPADAPSRRRVVHFEFAVGELPGGFKWQRRD